MNPSCWSFQKILKPGAAHPKNTLLITLKLFNIPEPSLIYFSFMELVRTKGNIMRKKISVVW